MEHEQDGEAGNAKSKPVPLAWLWGPFLLVVIAIALNGYFLYPHTEARGTFGDMFGGVNALFTGLAFAALIYTVGLQRQELSMQRTALDLTRHDLSQQNAAISAQRAENTFFELLRVHGDIVTALTIKEGVHTREGRRCFSVICGQLYMHYQPYTIHKPENPLKAIEECYGETHAAHHEQIAHYFRHLYHLIKFVKTSPLTDKCQYTSFVRAQLSSYELVLLFYNGLSVHGPP